MRAYCNSNLYRAKKNSSGFILFKSILLVALLKSQKGFSLSLSLHQLLDGDNKFNGEKSKVRHHFAQPGALQWKEWILEFWKNYSSALVFHATLFSLDWHVLNSAFPKNQELNSWYERSFQMGGQKTWHEDIWCILLDHEDWRYVM